MNESFANFDKIRLQISECLASQLALLNLFAPETSQMPALLPPVPLAAATLGSLGRGHSKPPRKLGRPQQNVKVNPVRLCTALSSEPLHRTYLFEITQDSLAAPNACAAMLQTRTWMAMIVSHGRQSLSSSSQIVEESTHPGPAEDEHRELKAVAAALANSSRLLRLITYIGEKYFGGETDKLHEYGIATEVFGRSKSTFNAGEDAIVRVEAHRLRKRLKEYYENEGKDHPIQLSIPSGTYIPVFTRRPASAETAGSSPPRRHLTVRWWFFAAASGALALTTFSIYTLYRTHHTERNAGAATGSGSAAGLPLSAASYADVPLRIMAGYSGKPHIDSAGAVWQPDQYFHYGGTWERPQGLVTRTSDQMLFDQWRNGDFSYDIRAASLLHRRGGAFERRFHFYCESKRRNCAVGF
jgi:hypothetical protein